MSGQGSVRDDALIPISLVVHQVFCPRRAWLEAAGESADSFAMAVGTVSHRPVDDEKTSENDIRGWPIEDHELGIAGKCDLLRRHPDGTLTVVEYKATPVRKQPTVQESTRVQLALQGMALENAGNTLRGYEVRFTSHRMTVPVDITEDDRVFAVNSVSNTCKTVYSAEAPPPLEDDPRCMTCSHSAVCLPDERSMSPVRRRIQVADPDSSVLHITTPGSRAFLKRGRIEISSRGEPSASVPLERVQALVLHGNSDVSSGLLRELFWRDVPVVWCSGTGRVMGWATTGRTPNGLQRVRQHEESAAGRLDLAKAFIEAKIANQATLLRRNGDASDAVSRMRTVKKRVPHVESLEQVLGLEGEASALYFGSFNTMLKIDWVNIGNRRGRGARDPVNVALNLAYGVLLAECIRAVVTCGLDPHAGFLHSANRNKPALALDLCEEFRPTVADSAVLRAFNNGELHSRDFSDSLGEYRLRDAGRRAVVGAVQQRLGAQLKHPIFGYSVTWRRTIEIQARLVLGVLDGTQPTYRGVTVR